MLRTEKGSGGRGLFFTELDIAKGPEGLVLWIPGAFGGGGELGHFNRAVVGTEYNIGSLRKGFPGEL